MSKPKFYKWIVEIQVAACWVADGFELTAERADNMLANDLSYAYSHELKAKVLSKPSDSAIAKEQGYNTVAAFRKSRERG